MRGAYLAALARFDDNDLHRDTNRDVTVASSKLRTSKRCQSFSSRTSRGTSSQASGGRLEGSQCHAFSSPRLQLQQSRKHCVREFVRLNGADEVAPALADGGYYQFCVSHTAKMSDGAPGFRHGATAYDDMTARKADVRVNLLRLFRTEQTSSLSSCVPARLLLGRAQPVASA
jgi:hypothetical protein